MSLYNMLFGENKSQASFLFSLLNKTPSDFGRYRDIYVTEDHIVVHTRNGGGNREYFEEVFEELNNHPLYDYDEDDDYDCTYANIYFRHPEGYSDILKELAEGTITPSEKWKILLTSMDNKGQ
jgi:hypothetical protein